VKVAALCLLYSILILAAGASTACADAGERVSLSEVLVSRGRLTAAQAQDQIERIVSAIVTELKAGKTVDIENFGSFSVLERPLQRTPKGSKKKSHSATRKYTRFRAADAVRAALNSGES